MRNHPLHKAIGILIAKDKFPDCDIFKDSACDKGQGHRITLNYGSGSNRVRLCDVDILIKVPEKAIVIIEVEESNVKPVNIFGKLFASAFSTHIGEIEIGNLPLCFIQVVDTFGLKIDRSKKSVQWTAIKTIGFP
jgi:hypothetical protein